MSKIIEMNNKKFSVPNDSINLVISNSQLSSNLILAVLLLDIDGNNAVTLDWDAAFLQPVLTFYEGLLYVKFDGYLYYPNNSGNFSFPLPGVMFTSQGGGQSLFLNGLPTQANNSLMNVNGTHVQLNDCTITSYSLNSGIFFDLRIDYTGYVIGQGGSGFLKVLATIDTFKVPS